MDETILAGCEQQLQIKWICPSCAKAFGLKVKSNMAGSTISVRCPYCQQVVNATIPSNVQKNIPTPGPAPKLTLVVEPGKVTRAQQFEMKGETSTMGRKSESVFVDMPIITEDHSMHRHQITFVKRERGFSIQQVGVNATYVNDEKMSQGDERYIHNGDVIKMASVTVNVIVEGFGASSSNETVIR